MTPKAQQNVRSGRVVTTVLANIVNLCYSPRMLTKRKKQNVIKEARTHDADTGSPQVQASLLSKQIDELSTHLRKNKKDVHSRRGLLQMVADRRKHLKYLERTDVKAYNALTKKLGLKR